MSDSGLRKTLMLDSLHIRVFTAKWCKINSSYWVYQNLQDIFWRLYFNKSDGAFLKFKGKTAGDAGLVSFPLQAGKAYFVPAGVRFNTEISREVDHFFVHFDVLGIPDLAMRTIFNEPICLLAPDWMLQTILNLSGEIDSGRQNQNKVDLILESQVKALLYQGLTLHLNTLPSEQLALSLQIGIAQKPVLPAINFINNNLTQTILNPTLAQLCQMNEDYFIHRFKECMGQTPGEYIREKRVKLVAQKLLFTNDSIEQIALSTGFGSRFYLSRVFTKSTGLSPVAYRKAARV